MEYVLFLTFYLSILTQVLHSKQLKNDELCFTVLGDTGGLPHAPFQTPSQRKVAKLMAKVIGKLNCKFVLGVGDNFYFNGVTNVEDPRFYWTFERTYSDSSLFIPWYMIAGNHDHAQNVSAQIAYSKVSTRWKYPDFFYSFAYSIPHSKKTIEFIMIDTTMLCWHNRKSGAPSPEVQLKWIEKKLKDSIADYLIVAGHHPVLSAGSHGNTGCLIHKLKPLLEKYKVTIYFSGHDHNLQHIKENDSPVHYFISGSGNFVDSRVTNKNKLPKNALKFEHGLLGGFILVRVDEDNMEMCFTNSEPKKLYQVKIKPRSSITLNHQSNVINNKIPYKETNNYINHNSIKMPSLLNTNVLISKNPTQAVSIKKQKLLPMLQSSINNQLKQVSTIKSFLGDSYAPFTVHNMDTNFQHLFHNVGFYLHTNRPDYITATTLRDNNNDILTKVSRNKNKILSLFMQTQTINSDLVENLNNKSVQK